MAEDGIGERTPSDVPAKDSLFSVGGVAVLRFQRFQEMDGRDIVAGLLMQSALADAVRARYPEVAGGWLIWLVEEDSSGSRNSLTIISQAWWCSIFFTETRSYRRSAIRSAVSCSADSNRPWLRNCASIEGW
jgi:hypothetical protein